jgi:hypothetical protein
MLRLCQAVKKECLFFLMLILGVVLFTNLKCHGNVQNHLQKQRHYGTGGGQMIVADILAIHKRDVLRTEKTIVFHSDLIAMDGKTGRILFDTHRSKKETITKYSSGEVIALWADVKSIENPFGDYIMPVMKCYVAHDSWKKQEVEQ